MIPERDTCLTCSDEAVTATVLELVDGDALVDSCGVPERIALDLVPDASPGDTLLCHAGIALSRVDESGS